MKSLFRFNRPLFLLPVCAAAVLSLAGCSTETELLVPEGAFTPEKTPMIPADNVSPAPGIGVQGPAGSTSVGGTTTVDDVFDIQPLPAREVKEPVKAPAKVSDAPVRRPAVTKNVAGEIYKVKKGDTLGAIAKRYKTNWRALAEYNGIDGKGRIFVGQTIRIPVSAASAKSAPAKNVAAKTAAKAAGDSGKIHVVKKGEFPGKIAAMYKVKVNDLLALNNLTGKKTIYVGQKLRIPAASAAPAKNVKKAAKKPAAKTTKKVAKKPAAKTTKKADDIPVVDEQKTKKTTGDDVLDGGIESKDEAKPAASESVVPVSSNVTVATPAAAEKEAANDANSLPLTIDKDMTLEQVSRAYDRSIDSLKKYNPSLKDGEVIKAGTTIKVPIF